MARYLLIAACDPFEGSDIAHCYDLAEGLRREGNKVTLFLVQNGVLAARVGAHGGRLDGLVEAGVTVLADDFSLRERGIARSRLIVDVTPSALDIVVDQLADGAKTIWH